MENDVRDFLFRVHTRDGDHLVYAERYEITAGHLSLFEGDIEVALYPSHVWVGVRREPTPMELLRRWAEAEGAMEEEC